jgi:hypothetical protein
MADFFGYVLLFLLLLPVTIMAALSMNPQALEIVEQQPRAGVLVAGVVFLAGVSTLLGESSILFVNRVRRSRFVFSLITNGLVFLISYFVWGLTIFLVARLLFDVHPPWDEVVRMVGLSTAPLVFGFLVLIPWMGPLISKLLSIWSLLILINIVGFEFKIGFWYAVLCVGLGWLASLIFSNTIGRPVIALRNRIFREISGSKLQVATSDILPSIGGARPEVATSDILLSIAGADLEQLPVMAELQDELGAPALPEEELPGRPALPPG